MVLRPAGKPVGLWRTWKQFGKSASIFSLQPEGWIWERTGSWMTREFLNVLRVNDSLRWWNIKEANESVFFFFFMGRKWSWILWLMDDWVKFIKYVSVLVLKYYVYLLLEKIARHTKNSLLEIINQRRILLNCFIGEAIKFEAMSTILYNFHVPNYV